MGDQTSTSECRVLNSGFRLSLGLRFETSGKEFGG